MLKKILLIFYIIILLISCETLNQSLSSLSNSISSAMNNISIGASSNEISNEPVNEQIIEIRAKWQQYRPINVTNIFNVRPSITNPYVQGSLTNEYLLNGLNTFKFIRYLAGLSENISFTDELNDLAQHGAVILAKLGNLTHTPSRPNDMNQNFYRKAYESTTSANIHMSSASSSTLQEAVRGFCDDSDVSNIDRLGHRRWMLNPKLGKIGFGYATSGSGSFITIQVFDQSNNERTDYDYVLWPNKGYFPNSFFTATQAWSVSLNPDSYNISRCRPAVKLTCLDNNREWIFTSNDKNKNGKYFNIERSNFGMPYCIIFRPDGITSLISNKRFKVEISGLVDKSGKNQDIVYEVEFFRL